MQPNPTQLEWMAIFEHWRRKNISKMGRREEDVRVVAVAAQGLFGKTDQGVFQQEEAWLMHAKRKEEGGAGHAMPITFVIMIITLIITLLRALQLHTKVQEDKFNLVIMIILSYSPTPPTTGGTSTRGRWIQVEKIAIFWTDSYIFCASTKKICS